MSNFSDAKNKFEEDYQRFITMKADMENMAQMGSEQLQAKMKSISELDHQVFLLMSEDESLEQRIKEQAESAKARNPTTSTASNSAKFKPSNSKTPCMSMGKHTEMSRDKSEDEGARYPRTPKGSSSRSRSEHQAINRLLSRKC